MVCFRQEAMMVHWIDPRACCWTAYIRELGSGNLSLKAKTKKGNLITSDTFFKYTAKRGNNIKQGHSKCYGLSSQFSSKSVIVSKNITKTYNICWKAINKMLRYHSASKLYLADGHIWKCVKEIRGGQVNHLWCYPTSVTTLLLYQYLLYAERVHLV